MAVLRDSALWPIDKAAPEKKVYDRSWGPRPLIPQPVTGSWDRDYCER